MSKITAMYIRLSMEDEDVSLNRKEESNSISSQRELLKAYIENHSELKDTKVQEYCDDGFTGTKFERPGYMKLMEDIRAEKISCIVVKDLSRLGRDYIEVGSLLEQILPLYQVRVIAVNDNYDSDNYDGSTGGMNVAFKNLIYMLYSRDLSNKICSAKHTRILNGENISGQLRYGYVKDPNDKHAFAMGIASVNPDAEVYVKITHSWYAPEAEKAASLQLLDMGCDVMAQHCDTPYPQTTAQDAGVYGIGYNSDMRKETPDACLCSVIWNWSAYYTSEVQSIIDGTYDGKNYYGGMAEGLVDITDLADFCADGTQEKVDEARAEILSGKCNVFDGKIETNTGDTIGKKGKTLDDGTITGGINWYYKNVKIVE